MDGLIRPSSYDRSDVATSLEVVQPLELASIRDEVRERPPWTPRATGAVVLSTLAIAVAVIAALIADRVTLGPGRVLGPVLVAIWAAAAVFVAFHRPREPLAAVMGFAALVGAAILLGAALAARVVATDSVRDFGAGMRAVGVALLPAVGLQLTLGLPAGELRTRARRLWVGAGYAGSVIVAAALVDQRPQVPVWPVAVLAVAAGIVGLVGYVARSWRRGERARARPHAVAGVGGGRGRGDLGERVGAQRAPVLAGADPQHCGRDDRVDPHLPRPGFVGTLRGAHRPPLGAHDHYRGAGSDGGNVLSPHRAGSRPITEW